MAPWPRRYTGQIDGNHPEHDVRIQIPQEDGSPTPPALCRRRSSPH